MKYQTLPELKANKDKPIVGRLTRTRMENRKVQIGSAYFQPVNRMISAAIKTPIDCTRSPMTCISAARTFMFALKNLLKVKISQKLN